MVQYGWKCRNNQIAGKCLNGCILWYQNITVLVTTSEIIKLYTQLVDIIIVIYMPAYDSLLRIMPSLGAKYTRKRDIIQCQSKVEWTRGNFNSTEEANILLNSRWNEVWDIVYRDRNVRLYHQPVHAIRPYISVCIHSSPRVHWQEKLRSRCHLCPRTEYAVNCEIVRNAFISHLHFRD